jgi:hypothetical protein
MKGFEKKDRPLATISHYILNIHKSKQYLYRVYEYLLQYKMTKVMFRNPKIFLAPALQYYGMGAYIIFE